MIHSLETKFATEKQKRFTGVGKCCGSFGELLQGVLPENEKFLVNLKIQDCSEAEITFYEKSCTADHDLLQEEEILKLNKSRRVIDNILNLKHLQYKYNLKIKSALPDGKGLSSSTADMVASIRAVENAFGITLSPVEFSALISQIEPNDGLHIEGTIAYNYISGKKLFNIDYVPPLIIVGLDTGGTVDTVNFNKIQTCFSKKEKQHYEILLLNMINALENKNLHSICSISTESSVLWQKVLPKPRFNEFLKISKELGSLGLINSHSGSFLGFAFNENHEINILSKEIRKKFPEYELRIFFTES